MNRKRLGTFIVLALLLAAALVPTGGASADVGPKPTIEIEFEQGFNGPLLSIVSGVLLECSSADCLDAKPLPGDMGPQHFTCQELTCSGLAYGFSDYGQLEITFSDGMVRRSNVFAIDNFNASYKATILENDLLVEERFNPTGVIIAIICVSLVLFVLIVLVGLVFLLRKKRVSPSGRAH